MMQANYIYPSILANILYDLCTATKVWSFLTQTALVVDYRLTSFFTIPSFIKVYNNLLCLSLRNSGIKLSIYIFFNYSTSYPSKPWIFFVTFVIINFLCNENLDKMMIEFAQKQSPGTKVFNKRLES